MNDSLSEPKSNTPLPPTQGTSTPRVGQRTNGKEATVQTSEAGDAHTQASARVPGLEIRLAAEATKLDEAIAERALQTLFSEVPLRRERIQLRVTQGHVTLSGSVATSAERVAIERLIGRIEGVTSVISLITVERHGRTNLPAHNVAEAYGGDQESGDVAGRIEAVFVREAGLEGTKITIVAVEGKVVLRGQVQSWREREAAERMAWATPGVTEVLDLIIVK